MTATPFPPDVVAAVARHMNDDHVEDSLLICRALGGQPRATAARMTGLVSNGFVFAAKVDGLEVEVVVTTAPLTERGQIRAEVVRLYHDACAAAGIEPRPSAEHTPSPVHPNPNEEPA
jgi:putative heme iron utilization protein